MANYDREGFRRHFTDLSSIDISMFDLIRKIRRRVVGRMLLFVVLPTIVIFASIVFMSSRSGFENLRHSEEKFIQLQAQLVAAQIEDLNASAVISAQRMAEAQVAGMFGDRESSIEYARMVLEDFEGITGAYFGYEPNADGKDAESLGKLPAEAMDPSGRFIPYWFVESAEGRTHHAGTTGRYGIQPLLQRCQEGLRENGKAGLQGDGALRLSRQDDYRAGVSDRDRW